MYIEKEYEVDFRPQLIINVDEQSCGTMDELRAIREEIEEWQ